MFPRVYDTYSLRLVRWHASRPEGSTEQEKAGIDQTVWLWSCASVFHPVEGASHETASGCE